MKLPLWLWRLLQVTCRHEDGEQLGKTVRRCFRCGAIYRPAPLRAVVSHLRRVA